MDSQPAPNRKRRKRKKFKRPRFRQRSRTRGPGDMLTIPNFCLTNAISESFYYGLKRRRLGPRETKVLKRVLITPEANEEEWRREREAATQAEREAEQAVREDNASTEDSGHQ